MYIELDVKVVVRVNEDLYANKDVMNLGVPIYVEHAIQKALQDNVVAIDTKASVVE